ncbi:hypothetical protein Hanom_Chr05g00469411 [Helianthus anomalus]
MILQMMNQKLQLRIIFFVILLLLPCNLLPSKQVIDHVKDVKDDKECVFVVKSNNVLYTLVGDAKIYSDNDFPIKNVNPSLIDKVFEDNTNKFLGKTIPGVVVTQCDPVPKS